MHTVWLVNGNLDTAAAWTKPLGRMGFAVRITDGETARDEGSRGLRGPDVVLVEQRLPRGRDGLELASHLVRAMDVPAVLVLNGSGNGPQKSGPDPELVARAVRGGVDSCLVWPCPPEQAAATLRAAVARKGAGSPAGADRIARFLQETEDRYQRMFHHSQAVNLLIEPESGDIAEANEAALSFYGYTSREMAGLKIWDINMLPRDEVLRQMATAQTRESTKFLFTHRLASGEMRRVMVYSGPVPFGERTLLYSTVLDITERQQMEEALMKSTADLERKARELQDMNATLRVLLAQRQRDREEVEEQVMESVDALIRPILCQLRGQCGDSSQERRLSVLERNLERITAPFAQRLMTRYRSLTPGEVRVADLVRGGRSNKEIADILNISVKTVEFHRANIRTKLGLTNQGVNLKTFLHSLV